MGYQLPKSTHPWKKGWVRPESENVKPAKTLKPLRLFLYEISTSWNKIEIFTASYGREDKFFLNELSQDKQANWIIGLLKKYLTYESEN